MWKAWLAPGPHRSETARRLIQSTLEDQQTLDHGAGFHVGTDGVGSVRAWVGDSLGAEGVGGDDAAFAHGVGDQRGQLGQACDGGVGGGVVDGHLGDLAHGVAEGGRVGLPVDGAGAGGRCRRR